MATFRLGPRAGADAAKLLAAPMGARARGAPVAAKGANVLAAGLVAFAAFATIAVMLATSAFALTPTGRSAAGPGSERFAGTGDEAPAKAISAQSLAGESPSSPARTQRSAMLQFTAAELAIIASLGPWPPGATAAADAANRVQRSAAAAAYGRRLFFDRSLSADGQMACASCHLPAKAFQDGSAVAEGRGAGARNTPSLLDVGQRRWLGWDGAHDSLWAASLAPLLDPREMASSAQALAQQVREQPARRAAHLAVFSAPLPTSDEQLIVQMAKALAAYQATLSSPRTAFDEFRDAVVQGDWRSAGRYPLAAQRGLRLFIGHARCVVCHAGAAFTNDEFADVGVPFFLPGGGVDAGRHGGLQKLLASPMNRLGTFNDAPSEASAAGDPRALLTRHLKIEPRHFGEFRVPSLRQLAHTAPYMHNGSLPTLQAVVRHYDHLDEERLHADGERILRPLKLSAEQAADLVAFLRSLSR